MRSVSVDYRNETLLGPHILGLVSANNVRIVALDGGLFRSDDNGKSWTPLMDWQTVGGNLSGLTEARLVEGNTLYVHAYCE